MGRGLLFGVLEKSYHTTMNEFFHGWRRKAGIATLVVACVVTGMWLRGLYVADIWCANLLGDYHVLQSGHGVVTWSRQLGIGRLAEVTESHVRIDHYLPEYQYSKWTEGWEPYEYWQCCWEYRLGDLGFGCHEQIDGDGLRTLWWRIGCKELVGVLTLLSAYLIFWKPRTRV